MVSALIKIDENTNRVLSVVRAKYGLKDKGKAIEFVVSKYVAFENEPDLRPEFIEKMKAIEKQKSTHVSDFAKRYGLKDV